MNIVDWVKLKYPGNIPENVDVKKEYFDYVMTANLDNLDLCIKSFSKVKVEETGVDNSLVLYQKGYNQYCITLTNAGVGGRPDEEFVSCVDKILNSKMFCIEKYLLAFESHDDKKLHCHILVRTKKYVDKSKMVKLNNDNHVKVDKINSQVHLAKCLNYLLKTDTKEGVDERVEPLGFKMLQCNFDFSFKHKNINKVYNIVTGNYIKNGV